MKRLTRSSGNTDMVWFIDYENNIDLEPCEMNSHHVKLVIQKLAYYENLEEQNRLNENFSKKWAVVGFDYEKAKILISAIEHSAIDKDILRRVQNKTTLLTEFTDGTSLSWVRASDSMRGRKFGKMWCDKNIDKDIFYNIIMPMYLGKKEDINWVDLG